MSDAPFPIVGSPEDSDETIQREWNRFALPDLPADPETVVLPPTLVARSSIDAVAANGTLDSLWAKLTHPADGDSDASEDRGTS